MRTLLVTAAVLAALVGTAHAQTGGGMTFERWYNTCQDTDTKTGAAKNTNVKTISNSQFCYGLTLGVAMGATYVIHENKLNTICIPDGTKTSELVDVGRLFYRHVNPSSRQKNFQAALTWAFVTAYPCDEEKKL
jgi:Rap1a immunity proteins